MSTLVYFKVTLCTLPISNRSGLGYAPGYRWQSWIRHQTVMKASSIYAEWSWCRWHCYVFPSGIGDAQKFHDRLVLAAADVGLHVNATKTKVLILNHPWSPPLQVKNIDLDFDDDFNYPGSFIATTENYVKKLQGQFGSLTCRLLSRFAFTSVPFWVFLLMVGNMDSNWITVWQARHFPT